MLGALPVAFALGTAQVRALALTAAALALVSLVDDAKPLPVAVRLPFHFGAAAIAVAVAWPDGAAPGPALLAGAALAFLAIAWMANLYNFMDGADGLAGGMTVIGFAAFAIAAARAGDPGVALLAGALSAAALAFLAFNFPPASLFMGDAGSVPLGFLAGAIGWHGVARGLWPAWFPVLVFSRVHHVRKKRRNCNAFNSGMAQDKAIHSMVRLCNILYTAGLRVLLCSGRNEKNRPETVEWLARHGVQYHELLLRKDEDYRPDAVIKRELLLD